MAMAMMASSMSPNLFSSPPPNPRINHPPNPQNTPPPLPLPVPKKKPNPCPKNPRPNLKQPIHTRTKYYKPLPSAKFDTPAVISGGDDGDRSVVVGPSGISYLLPNAPFEFQYSYSETPRAPPLAIREPAFLPFAPATMPRPWTGKAPLLSKKEKERKKNKIRLLEPPPPLSPPLGEEGGGFYEGQLRRIASRRVEELGKRSGGDGRSREEILGERLTKREIRMLVKPLLSTNRQLNLGKGVYLSLSVSVKMMACVDHMFS